VIVAVRGEEARANFKIGLIYQVMMINAVRIIHSGKYPDVRGGEAKGGIGIGTCSDHPHGDFIKYDRESRSLQHFSRNFTTDGISKHEISGSSDNETNNERDNIGLINYSIERSWSGHVLVNGRNNSVSSELSDEMNTL
jgi:hypothetical protein